MIQYLLRLALLEGKKIINTREQNEQKLLLLATFYQSFLASLFHVVILFKSLVSFLGFYCCCFCSALYYCLCFCWSCCLYHYLNCMYWCLCCCLLLRCIFFKFLITFQLVLIFLGCDRLNDVRTSTPALY